MSYGFSNVRKTESPVFLTLQVATYIWRCWITHSQQSIESMEWNNQLGIVLNSVNGYCCYKCSILLCKEGEPLCMSGFPFAVITPAWKSPSHDRQSVHEYIIAVASWQVVGFPAVQSIYSTLQLSAQVSDTLKACCGYQWLWWYWKLSVSTADSTDTLVLSWPSAFVPTGLTPSLSFPLSPSLPLISLTPLPITSFFLPFFITFSLTHSPLFLFFLRFFFPFHYTLSHLSIIILNLITFL